MISYKPDNSHEITNNVFSWSAIRNDYGRYVNMSNEEFMENIEEALHFAVFVCWIKELTTQQILADRGIIHELVHLVTERGQPYDITRAIAHLDEIRETFKRDLALA